MICCYFENTPKSSQPIVLKDQEAFFSILNFSGVLIMVLRRVFLDQIKN